MSNSFYKQVFVFLLRFKPFCSIDIYTFLSIYTHLGNAYMLSIYLGDIYIPYALFRLKSQRLQPRARGNPKLKTPLRMN